MAEISALKVTPSQLKTKAGEFKTKANSVRSTTKEMLTLINSISGATWSGDAADKFKTRFGSLDDDMDKIYAMIVEYSDDLEEIAKQYETTEKANETIANSLATDIF